MKPVTHVFSVALDHPVEQLWNIVADTQRMNQFVGNPKYEAYEVEQPDGSVDVFGRLRFGALTIEWQELPVNWIVNQWYEQTRRFKNGPLAELVARADLNTCENGSKGEYRLRIQPRNILGRIGAKRAVAKFEKGLKEMIGQAQRNLNALEPVRFETKLNLPAGARERAARIVERVENTPYGHGLAARLADFVLSTQEVDLWTLRPLVLARQWGVEDRLAIEVFLQAVREGLLESRWDLLCPRCRVSKAQSVTMDALPEGVHCASCNIDYEADFATNVELAFSPGPAVRPVEFGHFCRSGPGVTPHIKGQITLAPGERKSIPAVPAHGDYRLRTLESGGETDVTWTAGGFPGVVVADAEVVSRGESPAGTIAMANEGQRARTVIIEDRNWRRDVLTAERVTTLQAFRDLFSEQVLRPGDDVVISNISFMFTDLVGSTAMFRRIGDARAYQLVRDHFSLLGGVIRDHDGTIVKTTGDGIHAAFNMPENALRAAVEMLQAIDEAELGDEHDKLAIRIGLHTGSSISVTLNGRLDYYGTTVNTTARLEGEGNSGQITMSEAFADDVAVEPLLKTFDVTERSARLKGLADYVTIYQFQVNSKGET